MTTALAQIAARSAGGIAQHTRLTTWDRPETLGHLASELMVGHWGRDPI